MKSLSELQLNPYLQNKEINFEDEEMKEARKINVLAHIHLIKMRKEKKKCVCVVITLNNLFILN